MSADSRGEVGGRVFRAIDGGKWHRVWWQPWMNDKGVCVTHVGSYRNDMPIKERSEVPSADLCRVCFTPPTADETRQA